jgi:hypothetical protein
MLAPRETRGTKLFFKNSCETAGEDCPHLLALVDETFQQLSGPAETVWTEFSQALDEDDAENGLFEELFRSFCEGCEGVCDLSDCYENEGGPGMSSLELYYWSKDVPKSLAKLRKWAKKQKKKANHHNK